MSIKPKYVLVLCQSKEPVVMGKLIEISKNILKYENVILEFMSNPKNGKRDKGIPYEVNYSMYFNNTENTNYESKNIYEIDKPRKFKFFIESKKKLLFFNNNEYLRTSNFSKII